ncbi:MAG: large conductance mechanosensitive channel protein MscL, partial [Slackia sp.]|nr:large conductance mechanosensitive channel protein MscL [Slackia sp.]
MIAEFKEFIMRGSVLDLAVGMVIGSAFTAIVTGVVDGLITPFVGMVAGFLTHGGSLDGALSVLDVTVAGSTFRFGSVISSIVTFLITGFALFMIVKAANAARSRADALRRADKREEPIEPTEQDYLREIRDLLA